MPKACKHDRLILVDGMAVLYRAFFAIRELSTSLGRPTNAVFGFIRMLRQIRENWSPTHWAVVFDGGLPEERVVLLADYKAQRKPMPDPLREQISPVEDYLQRAGVAWTRQEGQEADDIIASIVKWAAPSVGEILVATGDKDLYQLVDEQVSIIPVSGQAAAMGPGAVKEKTGVAPSQIVSWLALVGDTADNIDGVPGVGPKTAAKLLNRFGDVQALMRGLEEVENPKLRESLRASGGIVERNVEMVKLRMDLDHPFEWDALELREPDPSNLVPFFEEMEFTAMLREIREPELF